MLQLSKISKRATGWVDQTPSYASTCEQLADALNLSPNSRTAHPPASPLKIVVSSAFRPRSTNSSSTSRDESDYRRHQRTLQRLSSGSVCRHLKITGRIAFFMISSGYQPPSAKVTTEPCGRVARPGAGQVERLEPPMHSVARLVHIRPFSTDK